MNLAQVLSAYVNLNVLIIIAFFGLSIFSFFLKKLNTQIESKQELQLHYGLIIFTLCLALIQPLFPQNKVFEPTAKIWSSVSTQNFAKEYQSSKNSGFLIMSNARGVTAVQAHDISSAWSAIGSFILILGFWFTFRDFRRLLKLKRNSFLIKSIGQVHILLNDNIHVPFSYWLPGQSNIVLPASFIGHNENYRMAIAHEIQHHRNGDTRWVYLMWILKLVCIINPAIYLWNRWIAEIQEFACDETLVDRNKVESQAYARCLVEVAQTAIHQKHLPVRATGLMFLIDRNLLYRRIEKMFSKPKVKIRKPIVNIISLIIISLMSIGAFATSGIVQDRRVSLAQANVMAEQAQLSTEFPIVMNDLVLKQLNRFIGTPEGRMFIRSSLDRMETHKAIIQEHIKKYGLPLELLAVPIIESGYQNLSQQSNRSSKAAGIWQFIPQTARNFGLRVDKYKDERLDIILLTDAAMRYLQSNHLRFKDWHLSALAYNMGENAVQKVMDSLETRDAWKLIRNGYEGDKDYLPKLMAAILIMKNPESVQ